MRRKRVRQNDARLPRLRRMRHIVAPSAVAPETWKRAENRRQSTNRSVSEKELNFTMRWSMLATVP